MKCYYYYFRTSIHCKKICNEKYNILEGKIHLIIIIINGSIYMYILVYVCMKDTCVCFCVINNICLYVCNVFIIFYQGECRYTTTTSVINLINNEISSHLYCILTCEQYACMYVGRY